MKIKGWIKPYLYCFLIAFLFLMVCSKNSSLYYMNDWVDANAFFTVGKGMVRGIVPYQSLFEQKGPLLYLIYGIGSFIHYQSFLGVFILEVFSFSIFLYFTYKIIILFYNEKSAYFIIPVFTLLLVTLKSFSHGGSAEEFTLPFFMVSLYFLISYLKSEELLLSNKIIFLIGILAGCVLWIKYTLLGFWFGWILGIFEPSRSQGNQLKTIWPLFLNFGSFSLYSSIPYSVAPTIFIFALSTCGEKFLTGGKENMVNEEYLLRAESVVDRKKKLKTSSLEEKEVDNLFNWILRAFDTLIEDDSDQIIYALTIKELSCCSKGIKILFENETKSVHYLHIEGLDFKHIIESVVNIFNDIGKENGRFKAINFEDFELSVFMTDY